MALVRKSILPRRQRYVADADTYAGGNAAAVDTRDRAGRRYTMMVSCLKLGLPGAAVLLLLLAVLWPSLSRTTDAITSSARDSIKITPDQLRNFVMDAPTYIGVDEKNRPFKLRAKQARQATAKSTVVNLVQPRANLTLQNGNWVAVSARDGRYRRDTRILRLRGDVNVFHDANYTFKTEEATVDLKNKTAWGDKPVVATGPRARIQARGFRVKDGGKTVLFTGKAKVVLKVDNGDLNQVFGPPTAKSPDSRTRAVTPASNSANR